MGGHQIRLRKPRVSLRIILPILAKTRARVPTFQIRNFSDLRAYDSQGKARVKVRLIFAAATMLEHRESKRRYLLDELRQ